MQVTQYRISSNGILENRFTFIKNRHSFPRGLIPPLYKLSLPCFQIYPSLEKLEIPPPCPHRNKNSISNIYEIMKILQHSSKIFIQTV